MFPTRLQVQNVFALQRSLQGRPRRLITAGALALALAVSVLPMDGGGDNAPPGVSSASLRVASPSPNPSPSPVPSPLAATFAVDVGPTGYPYPLMPDTCVGFRPSAASLGRVIFIDPGHGGVDSGAVGSDASGPVSEKVLTLREALVVRDVLLAKGYTVVMSRLGDSMVANLPDSDYAGPGTLNVKGVHDEIEARTSCANAAHAAVLLNLHLDSGGEGTETFYCDARDFTPTNQRLAQGIQAGLIGAVTAAGHNVSDNGILGDSQVNAPTLTPEDAAYGHYLEVGPYSKGLMDFPSTMPGVISEFLFISDPGDVALVESDSGALALANGYADGLTKYFTGA